MKTILKNQTAKTGLVVITIVANIVQIAGCAGMSPTQSGALAGGGIGAVGGALIGGDTKSTLIGAGVGALGGALLNDHMAREKEKAYQQGAQDASR